MVPERIDENGCLPIVSQRSVSPVGCETTAIFPCRPGDTELRTNTLKNMSRNQAAQVCMWLANRQPGESEMDIETRGSSTDNNWLLPYGERGSMRTNVRIR